MPGNSKISLVTGLATWLRTWTTVLCLGATVAAAGWACLAVERIARRHPRTELGWSAIAITPQPPWIAVPIKERALERSPLPRRLRLLEPELAKQIAGVFILEPWVRRVVATRLYRRPLCVVQLEYREPVALVAYRSELVPVDVEGVVLPVGELTSLKAYPRVLVGRVPEVPDPGVAWDSPQVRAAAKLAAFLGPHQPELRIAAIDASRYRGDDPPTGPLELLTHGGTRVIWGRPPGTSYSGELSAEVKLQRLLDYVEQFGSLEAPAGPYEIDVTRWTGMTRRKPGDSPWRPAGG